MVSHRRLYHGRIFQKKVSHGRMCQNRPLQRRLYYETLSHHRVANIQSEGLSFETVVEHGVFTDTPMSDDHREVSGTHSETWKSPDMIVEVKRRMLDDNADNE